MADERIIYAGRIPFKVFHGSHGVLWMIALGWNVGLLISLVQSLCWRIRITSQRVVVTRGLLSQTQEEVEFYRVRDTRLQQGVVQRLFGVATITLISDDVTAPELTFSIHDAQNIREQVRESIREQRLELIAVQVD